MAPTRDANVVKLAVEMRATESRPIPYLGEFSLQQPLAAFIVVSIHYIQAFYSYRCLL